MLIWERHIHVPPSKGQLHLTKYYTICVLTWKPRARKLGNMYDIEIRGETKWKQTPTPNPIPPKWRIIASYPKLSVQPWVGFTWSLPSSLFLPPGYCCKSWKIMNVQPGAMQRQMGQKLPFCQLTRVVYSQFHYYNPINPTNV